MRAACFDGPKQAMPAAPHGVGDTQHQRHLGSDHHQVLSATAAVPALPGATAR